MQKDTEDTADIDGTQKDMQAEQIEKVVDLLEKMQAYQAIRAQESADKAAFREPTVDPLFKEETMLTAAALAKDLGMEKSAEQFTTEALVAKGAQSKTTQAKTSKRRPSPEFRLAV